MEAVCVYDSSVTRCDSNNSESFLYSVPNKCHAKECCAMTQVVQALRKFENFRDVLQEALACVKNMCLEYEGSTRIL